MTLLRLAEGPRTLEKQEAFLAILAKLNGPARAECIRLLEGDAQERTMASLMASALPEPGLRAQADALVAAARDLPPPGKREHMVISDLDDTLQGWKDLAFKGRPLPGAASLVRALDEGFGGKGTAGDVHVVTARPFLWNIILSASRALFGARVRYGSIAYGGWFGGLFSLFGHPRRMIDDKVRNLVRLIDKNPGLDVFLMGDSGQSDAEVFLRVIELRGDRVAKALIREVPGAPVREDFARNPKALVFKGYDQAARALSGEGVIDKRQLNGVLRDVGREVASAGCFGVF